MVNHLNRSCDAACFPYLFKIKLSLLAYSITMKMIFKDMTLHHSVLGV